MTPSFVPAEFTRQMSCKIEDLLALFPLALAPAELTIDHVAEQCVAQFDYATLTLRWETIHTKALALVQLPQILLHFHYVGCDAACRYQIQKKFDVYTQRGGG